MIARTCRLLLPLTSVCILLILSSADAERFAPQSDAPDGLLRSVRVMPAVVHKQLTVFPVRLGAEYADFLPRTFDEAVESKELIVQEVNGGSVNTVRLRNTGARPVFIMAGEIMSGSKQDRTVQRDVLIPAHSDWIEVPVYCVEAGRWTAVSPTFGTRKSLAAPALRKDAYSGASQSAIWGQVDRAAAANAVSQSPGRAFQEIYDDEEVQARVREYERGIRVPGGSTIGLVAFRGSEPIGADLFSTPALFGKLKAKILRSYILSVGVPVPRPGDEPLRAMGPPTAHDAARYLALGWSGVCPRQVVPTPGVGTSLRLLNKTADVGGGALVYDRGVVHFSMFPQVKTAPPPVQPLMSPEAQMNAPQIQQQQVR